MAHKNPAATSSTHTQETLNKGNSEHTLTRVHYYICERRPLSNRAKALLKLLESVVPESHLTHLAIEFCQEPRRDQNWLAQQIFEDLISPTTVCYPDTTRLMIKLRHMVETIITNQNKTR